jgi:hypothetical protein
MLFQRQKCVMLFQSALRAAFSYVGLRSRDRTEIARVRVDYLVELRGFEPDAPVFGRRHKREV